MRRRWHWPILRRLRESDPENWIGAWIVWLILGFLLILLPAMIVDTRGGTDTLYMGAYLRDALIVYAVPLLFGVAVFVGRLLRDLVADYGHELIPRRVRESAEDLREHYHGPD